MHTFPQQHTTPVDVIGGSGFIGTSLVTQLQTEGYNNIRIIDLTKGSSFPELTCLGDIRKPADLTRLMRRNGVVYHLAAVHHDNVRPIQAYNNTNVEGTKNVLAAAIEKKTRHIIFTSSVAVYGLNTVCSEDAATAPFNEYGRTKLLAEKLLTEWQDSQPEKRKLSIVRPTVVFGPGNRGNVYNLLRALSSKHYVMIGNGDNKKSIAYVQNVAAFLCYLINADGNLTVTNYADQPAMTVGDLCRTVRNTLQLKETPVLQLPRSVAITFGVMLDVIAFLTRTALPLSATRVKKFTATTVYTSNIPRGAFAPPVAIIDAVKRTVLDEFS